MKNPKARTSKKSAQASRTMTRQSAMNDISRGPYSFRLTNSELGASEIEHLKRKFSDGEVFELPDSDIPSRAVAQDSDMITAEVQQQAKPDNKTEGQFTTTSVGQDSNQSVSANASHVSEDKKQQSTKDKSQNRHPLPPKPFTIISGFRK